MRMYPIDNHADLFMIKEFFRMIWDCEVSSITGIAYYATLLSYDHDHPVNWDILKAPKWATHVMYFPN